MQNINISGFNPSSIVDGPNLRFTAYTQGCEHRCKGCHNPETWSNKPNKIYSVSQIIKLIEEESLTKNITISGGDPLLQIEPIFELCKQLKEKGYNIWLYTGYTVEEIREDNKLQKILDVIDTLVDGRFEIDKKEYNGEFKGSSNQKIFTFLN